MDRKQQSGTEGTERAVVHDSKVLSRNLYDIKEEERIFRVHKQIQSYNCFIRDENKGGIIHLD